MRAYVNACQKGCETSTDVTQFKVNGLTEKLEKWKRFSTRAEKGTRPGYETGNHVTQIKRNKITDILEKKERTLMRAEKGARLALM